MNSNKLFVTINIFFIFLVVVNVILLLTGTQYWFDISRSHYELYLWYSGFVPLLSPLLLIFPVWSLYRLYALGFPKRLLLLNISPLLLLTLTLFFAGCEAVFLPLIIYAVSYVLVIVLTKILARGWGSSVKGRLSVLLLWYFWQGIIAMPTLLFFGLIAGLGCLF